MWWSLDLGAVVLAQELLGDRHADAVGEALAERAGRDLDAGRDVDAVALRVARRDRAPLAELLELVHREVVAGEVQDAVEQHRAVAGAEHEAVAVGPRRILRVVAHDAAEQDVGGRRHGHRQAGVPGVRLLDRVHRQRADRVDAELLGLGGHGREVSRRGSLARARLDAPLSPARVVDRDASGPSACKGATPCSAGCSPSRAQAWPRRRRRRRRGSKWSALARPPRSVQSSGA